MSDIVKNLKTLSEAHLEHHRNINKKIEDILYLPQAEALVGKCFKKPNSYGQKNWWMYTRILSRNHLSLITEWFQEDSYKKIEFSYNEHSYYNSFSSPNCIEITEKEYLRAQNKLLDKIKKRSQRKVKK